MSPKPASKAISELQFDEKEFLELERKIAREQQELEDLIHSGADLYPEF